MAASELTSNPTISTMSTMAITLPADIMDLIISKMSYPSFYKLHLSGNSAITTYLLKNGRKIITLLEPYMNSDSDYSPIGDDFDFTNLDVIIKQIWNMIICISSLSNINNELLSETFAFITMECEEPDSVYDIYSDIWETIIIEYLDSEYSSHMNWLGGYKRLKYICRAISKYSSTHNITTLNEEKYTLSILIKTYLGYKEEIMQMYSHEEEKIDTNQKYYKELRNLIATVSHNGDLATSLVSKEFVKKTFYFMLDYQCCEYCQAEQSLSGDEPDMVVATV
jgi:hypothetical protein